MLRLRLASKYCLQRDLCAVKASALLQWIWYRSTRYLKDIFKDRVDTGEIILKPLKGLGSVYAL